ncbi:protein phosphatase 2C [Pelomyxa schiedti]|nr:protein phosphatase 2C [Pelomyxa schiedti]
MGLCNSCYYPTKDFEEKHTLRHKHHRHKTHHQSQHNKYKYEPIGDGTSSSSSSTSSTSTSTSSSTTSSSSSSSSSSPSSTPTTTPKKRKTFNTPSSPDLKSAGSPRSSQSCSTLPPGTPSASTSKTSVSKKPEETQSKSPATVEFNQDKYKQESIQRHTEEEYNQLLARFLEFQQKGRPEDITALAEKEILMQKLSTELEQCEARFQQLYAENDSITKQREALSREREATTKLLERLRLQIEECGAQLQASHAENQKLREILQLATQHVIKNTPQLGTPSPSTRTSTATASTLPPTVTTTSSKSAVLPGMYVTSVIPHAQTLPASHSTKSAPNLSLPGANPVVLDLGRDVSSITDLLGGRPPLLRETGSHEDFNLAGLRRGNKKAPMLPGGKTGKLEMEDAHFHEYPWCGDPDRALLAVFDGFGGKDASFAAKKIFPRVLSELYGANPPTTDAADLIRSCFAKVDQEMRVFECVGTTCTVVLLWRYQGRRYIQSGNVGDSSAFFCHDGKALELSREHKVVAEHERLKAFGIESHQTRVGGISVARALGVSYLKDTNVGIIADPHISPAVDATDLNSTAFVVIASDGVWDVFSGQEACDLINKEPDANAMAACLINKAITNKKCHDNVTVVVGRLL